MLGYQEMLELIQNAGWSENAMRVFDFNPNDKLNSDRMQEMMPHSCTSWFCTLTSQSSCMHCTGIYTVWY